MVFSGEIVRSRILAYENKDEWIDKQILSTIQPPPIKQPSVTYFNVGANKMLSRILV